MKIAKRWVLFGLFLLAATANADELPGVEISPRDRSLWDAGIVGGEAYLPDYPAAGQNHAKWIIAPYIIYRGKIVRADREGARARLMRSRYVNLEMSFAATFATNSKDNDARRDMPDLDYLLELGPRLSIPLSDLAGYGKLQLFLPVRAVFSTDFGNFKHRGYTTTPALYLRSNDLWRKDWIGIMQLTASFGDRQIAGYFYDVKPKFALPDRPFYDARAGYMGTDLFSGLVVPIGERYRLFGGAQVLLHHAAANADSPLFKHRTNYSLILGISYKIYRSPKPAYPLP